MAMGNVAPLLACFSATEDVHYRDFNTRGHAAAIHVTLDASWAPQQTTVLRVPSHREDARRLLWTTPVATLKRALLNALDEPNGTEPSFVPMRSDMQQTGDGGDAGRADEEHRAHSVFVSILACARCGRADGCGCGWRRDHEVPVAAEVRSLAQLLPRLLPNASAADLLEPPPSIHLRLFESPARPPAAWLEASVVQFKVVDPMVERPRALFRIDVQFGDQLWSVSRRFQEFARLHAALERVCRARPLAAPVLPALPPATWFRRLDDPFLHARRAALDRYVCCLLLIDCVRDSVELLAFLGAVSTARETLVRPAAGSLCPTEVLHLRVLQYYVHAGDLLLFQSRGAVSSLQRSATGSEWDHVAVVVPRAGDDCSKGFLLLEATGDGVTALPLTSRLYAYSAFHTSRVALRQLHTPLLSTAVRSELLQRFTDRVNGRAYGLSVSKILRTNEQPRGCRVRSLGDAGGRDYFCSELIADAYRALGLVDASLPSSNFWPSSFATGAFADTELARHGAALAAPIAVDCLLLEVALARAI